MFADILLLRFLNFQYFHIFPLQLEVKVSTGYFLTLWTVLFQTRYNLYL